MEYWNKEEENALIIAEINSYGQLQLQHVNFNPF